ncbi:MAG: hypothetical protein K0R31_1816, partial [Clostridiales bacterium]|nr:hypothetical protein [Clostridiales bacterium]
TVWPVFLSVILLSRSGVAPLNTIIGASFGNWVVYFVLMSFIMTHALSESGFINRVVAKFMSMKFVTRTPWVFTFCIGILGMILAAFMDQVPAAAFMLAFCNTIYKEMGYTKNDMYPHITNIVAIFSVNIGGAMTPISHPLAILGLGVYEGITKTPISLFTYLAFGLPTGIVLFALMTLMIRIFAKPDMSKFKDFNIQNVLQKQNPMDLKEKTTVFIFFFTVIMWMLPGILNMFMAGSPFVQALNTYGITFWAIFAVILLSVISINGEPVVSVAKVVNKNINWAILIFIGIGVYLGSAVTDKSTGVSDFITQNVIPLTNSVSPFMIVILFAFVTIIMTNFASNVTSITLMTGVAVTFALGTNSVNPVAIALVITFCGSLAFTFPSGFATIAMIHGDEFSGKAQIYKYGFAMIAISTIIASVVGYNIATML